VTDDVEAAPREPSGNRPVQRFLSRWGFPLFVLVMLVLGRAVLLPFVFAALIAYILAPVVRWMSERRNGTRRMPRGLAIVICYIVFLAAVTGFMFLLVPRLSSDISKLGQAAPKFYTDRVEKEWTPEIAHWLENRFPTLQTQPPQREERPVVTEPPLPPDSAFVMTPLPDGRIAVQIAPGGVDAQPLPEGGYHLQPREAAPAPMTLEDKLRDYTHRTLLGLQSQLNDVLRAGQEFVADFIRGIFLFFFTLMIGAFMLIDLEKVHAFLRSLFPANVRDDYDVIIAGIDQGMSGVIRGQLVICVINAAFTYVGLLVFGVNYALILAIVAGLMSLIPIFGSILSSVPIVLVALASGDDGIDVFRGLGMLLWIIGIHFVEANVLNPKIIGTAAKIHPVLVIFALFFGEASFGLVGALLAVPILAAIQVVFMFFYRKTWKDAGRTGPVVRAPK
jgi:predicted PurR-regulated permease PerM